MEVTVCTTTCTVINDCAPFKSHAKGGLSGQGYGGRALCSAHESLDMTSSREIDKKPLCAKLSI